MEQWNELDDEYAFVYMNPENGSKNVLVKCLSMNDKLLVDALADRSFQPVLLKIDVGDYVGEDGGSNYSAQFKNLENLVKKLYGLQGRGLLLLLLLLFFFFQEDSKFSNFFFLNYYFYHVAHIWQPRQHLTDQWMKNVTDVLF
ncbi:unnamed protein product [Malus baccata var. baccata]